jgi:hypothetical protein
LEGKEKRGRGRPRKSQNFDTESQFTGVEKERNSSFRKEEIRSRNDSS